MSEKVKILIIGGGLAGLSTAVFLCENNFEIEIYESSPKFGGRTYSFFDNDFEEYLDNGKHILAGWYEKTKKYLEIIDSKALINYQKSLAICLYNTKGEKFEFNTEKYFSPLNYLAGILKFKAVKFKDKISILKLLNALKKGQTSEYETVSDLLTGYNQSEKSKKYFWNPLIYAVFNASGDNVASEYLERVIKNGFLKKEYSGLGLPVCNLGEIFIDNALNYLKKNGVKYNSGNEIKEVSILNRKIDYIVNSKNEKLLGNIFVFAIPFWSYNKLFENKINLKTSSVVSIHIKLNKESVDNMFGSNKMIGLIDTTSQWIFRESEKFVTVVISNADENRFIDKNNTDIFEIVKNDIKKCFNFMEDSDFINYKVVKEKRATFIPDVDSLTERKKIYSEFENAMFAGDWVNTGLSSTIEGSIFSGWECAEKIKKIYN